MEQLLLYYRIYEPAHHYPQPGIEFNMHRFPNWLHFGHEPTAKRWHNTHLCSFPISSVQHSPLLDSNPNNQSINLGGELVPFLYVEKVSTSVHHTCIRFPHIDLIFKRNSRQSNSNSWKVFFRQVYKPLGPTQILSTHITFYSHPLSISSKSTLKCVRYWSSSASSCWPSHLLVMFDYSMY
jgi:hypothetical protein